MTCSKPFSCRVDFIQIFVSSSYSFDPALSANFLISVSKLWLTPLLPGLCVLPLTSRNNFAKLLKCLTRVCSATSSLHLQSRCSNWRATTSLTPPPRRPIWGSALTARTRGNPGSCRSSKRQNSSWPRTLTKKKSIMSIYPSLGWRPFRRPAPGSFWVKSVKPSRQVVPLELKPWVEQGPWETGPSSWPDSWGPKSAWFLTQLGKSF